MQKILLIGAGKSTTYLIDYLAKHAAEGAFSLTVGDVSMAHAEKKLPGLPPHYSYPIRLF